MWLQVIYLNINENTRIAEVEGVSWGLYQADEKFDSVILGKSDYYEVDGLFSSVVLTELVTRILLMTFSWLYHTIRVRRAAEFTIAGKS